MVPRLLILEGFSHHHAPYSGHHEYYFQPFWNNVSKKIAYFLQTTRLKRGFILLLLKYYIISKLKKCWKRGNAMSYDMLTHTLHPTHLFYITIFHPPRLFKSPRLIFLNNFLPTTFIQDPTFIRNIRVLTYVHIVIKFTFMLYPTIKTSIWRVFLVLLYV